MDEIEPGAAGWQDALHDLLRRSGVSQFCYVPDAGHRVPIDPSSADPQVRSVALTEEEGVALLAGADLGGGRGVLSMQSSGTGNCIDMPSPIEGGRFLVLKAGRRTIAPAGGRNPTG
jgi:sulfopyruvate decarboxylase TPP-binding subunit